MEIDPMVCSACNGTFTYSPDDIFTAEFGCAFVYCPRCGGRYEVLDPKYQKTITPDTISFPNDFYTAAGRTSLSENEINAHIQAGLKDMKKHDRGYWHSQRGDTDVFIIDKGFEVSVFVARNAAMTVIDEN